MDSIFLRIVLCAVLLAGPVLCPLYCGTHHHFLTSGEHECAVSEVSGLEPAFHESDHSRKECACTHEGSVSHALSDETHPATGPFLFDFWSVCSFHCTSDSCSPGEFSVLFLHDSFVNEFLFLLMVMMSVLFFLRASEFPASQCIGNGSAGRNYRGRCLFSRKKIRLYVLKNALLN